MTKGAGFTEKQKAELTQIVGLAIDQRLRPTDRRLRKIERDLKTIINYFDQEYLDHDKRITRIESHLGLQSN